MKTAILLAALPVVALPGCASARQLEPANRFVEIIRYEVGAGSCTGCAEYSVIVDSDGHGRLITGAAGNVGFKVTTTQFEEFRRTLQHVRIEGELILDGANCDGRLKAGYPSIDVSWFEYFPAALGPEPKQQGHIHANLGCDPKGNAGMFDIIKAALRALPSDLALPRGGLEGAAPGLRK